MSLRDEDAFNKLLEVGGLEPFYFEHIAEWYAQIARRYLVLSGELMLGGRYAGPTDRQAFLH